MNTLGELIETLEDLAKTHGADAEVRIAHMGYRSKMEYRLDDVVDVELYDDDETETGATMVVYLVESHNDNYLPSRARKAIDGEL